MQIVNPTQVQKFLEGVDYPASKEALIQHAEQQGADENVLETLKRLPDQDYETPAEVNEALGMMTEEM